MGNSGRRRLDARQVATSSICWATTRCLEKSFGKCSEKFSRFGCEVPVSMCEIVNACELPELVLSLGPVSVDAYPPAEVVQTQLKLILLPWAGLWALPMPYAICVGLYASQVMNLKHDWRYARAILEISTLSTYHVKVFSAMQTSQVSEADVAEFGGEKELSHVRAAAYALCGT